MRSPERCSGVLLVARTRSPGAERSSPEIAGAAATTCSRLSSSNSSSLSLTYPSSVSSIVSPGYSRRPSVCAIVGTTSSQSRTGESETKKTPFWNRSIASAATWSASRVFPAPPVPVSVRRRRSSRERSSSTSASSRARPMNALGRAGRFVGRLSSVFSGGNSAGRPSISSWYRCCGPVRSFSRCSPRSRSRTRSSSSARVDSDKSTCPPCPAAITRAPWWTSIPT